MGTVFGEAVAQPDYFSEVENLAYSRGLRATQSSGSVPSLRRRQTQPFAPAAQDRVTGYRTDDAVSH
jgi:hypothetical protein